MEIYVLGGHPKVRPSMTEQEYCLYYYCPCIRPVHTTCVESLYSNY